MNKLKSFLKISLVFVFTVVLGLWSGGFFERYIISFGFAESFSISETRALLGKRVKNSCQGQKYSDVTGEIVGHAKQDFGDIFLTVRWENFDSETSGVLLPTGFSKGAYKQCLKFAESK